MPSLHLQTLLNRVNADKWREGHPFSVDLDKAQSLLWKAETKEAMRDVILAWLGKFQPCLFGRIAARAGAISMCILTEQDILEHDDTWVRDYIQLGRLEWTGAAFRGESSAFVVALVSPRIARAVPDAAAFELARYLCSLYLLRDDIVVDQVFHDEVFLEVPNRDRTAWKWLAGVNYFAAGGDGRWWQDHCFPGGMAFSVNSIGHFVKSGILVRAEASLHEIFELGHEQAATPRIDSLPRALEWAMRTINGSTEVSGTRATRLVMRTNDTPLPPEPLPKHLENFEHRHYEGWYHTDYSLPSELFRPDVAKRPETDPFTLDFTYLFDHDVRNPDHITVARGRRIRDDVDERASSLDKASAEEIDIATSPLLMEALRYARPGYSPSRGEFE